MTAKPSYFKVKTQDATQAVVMFTHPEGEFHIGLVYSFTEAFLKWVDTQSKQLNIVFDIKNISYIDSKGVYCLREIHNHFEAQGRRLTIAHVEADMVKKVFEIFKLHLYFEII